MQRYLATMCYEHENYVNDIERKKQYKKDMRWPQKVRLLRDDFGRLVFLYAARR